MAVRAGVAFEVEEVDSTDGIEPPPECDGEPDGRSDEEVDRFDAWLLACASDGLGRLFGPWVEGGCSDG
jgi:hypothetical protein